MSKGNRKYIQMDYYYTQKNCKSYLDDLMSTVASMGRRLNKFIELSNGKLEGKEFKILLGRLAVYAETFNYFGRVGDILINNIVSANNTVINTMGGHKELTDEYLTELEEKISNCNSLIATANSKLSSLSDDAKEQEKKVIDGYRGNLSELQAEKTALEELLDATEGADGTGVTAVGDVIAKVDALKAKMMY